MRTTLWLVKISLMAVTSDIKYSFSIVLYIVDNIKC